MPDPDTGEISWYRPDPRAIIPLERFHVSRSLRRSLNRVGEYTVSYDQNFVDVMRACADREETWINQEIFQAYYQLFLIGAAHSVEIKTPQGDLVGGVYGVSFGGAFFAESMFSRVSDGSKMALHYLVEKLKERQFQLLEVQFLTSHLKSLGAVAIPDQDYIQKLQSALAVDTYFSSGSGLVRPTKKAV